MPVQGLPDPELHRACLRCQQWFEEDEGRMVERAAGSVSGGLAQSIRAAAGDSNLRFICASCESRHRHRFVKVVGALLLVAALLWAWQFLGWP